MEDIFFQKIKTKHTFFSLSLSQYKNLEPVNK